MFIAAMIGQDRKAAANGTQIAYYRLARRNQEKL
ncbi:UNVERIFIED_ORG: hypothetical protein GGE64_000496 [Rhizobium etli]